MSILAIDEKSLKNQHTEEMISKDYFQQWLHLKTKINVPILLICFSLQIVNLISFVLFDTVYFLIENDLEKDARNVCKRSNKTLSCLQTQSSSEIVCFLELVYFCLALILILNIVSMFIDIRDSCALVKNFKFIIRTPLGKRRYLVHTRFYKVVDTVMHVSILANVMIRFVRYQWDLHIPVYWDNLTFFLVCFCTTWSLLFYMQLVPYIGYMAIVLKLMMKNTVIFVAYMSVFLCPYGALFARINNYGRPAGECDRDWKNRMTNLYSSFLLLFNMLNFQKDHDTVNDGTTKQVQVCIRSFYLVSFLKVLIFNMTF